MNIENILKAAFFTPTLNEGWGLPLLFEGPPGVGKSARIEGAADAAGIPCTTLVASIREPSDFGGLPIPQMRGKQTVVDYAPPSWALEAVAEGRMILFLDEITTCAPAVQAALLRMQLNRELGDFKLPNGVRFVSACNPTDQAAGGWDLAAPLANRFGHLRWPASDAEGWRNWLLSNGTGSVAATDADAEEARVEKLWPKAYAKARGLVAAFIKRKPSLLFQMPDAGDPKASKAWPSPRTWELATRAIASADIHSLSPMDADALIAAFIGQGACVEFVKFRTAVDLPDPEEVLDGTVKFKHNPKRLDRTYAVLSSCAAFIPNDKSPKKTLDARAKRLWTILEAVGETTADLIIDATKSLVKSDQWRFDEADKVLERLEPILAAAGIKPGDLT